MRVPEGQSEIFHVLIFVFICNSTDHDELLLSPCQSYIENAKLLAHALSQKSLLYSKLLHSSHPAPCGKIQIICRNAEMLINQHAVPQTHPVERLIETCHEHDRILESLAFVNTDYADDIFIFTYDIDTADLDLFLHHPVNVADKIEQSDIARLLIVNGLINKKAKVCRPLDSSRQSRRVIHKPCAGQDHPDEFVQRRVGHRSPHTLKKLKENFQPALKGAVRHVG